MIKKLFKILSIFFIFIIIILVIYKINLVNQAKERVVGITKHLIDSISDNDYDKIRLYLKKTGGIDLSNQEITNYLLNTGLYRTLFITDEDPSFTYLASVDFFNLNKGKISFIYKALDGDLIVNELEYHNLGEGEYFITNDINVSDKKIKQYPFARDLSNGKEIGYSDSESKDNEFLEYQIIKDENGEFYIEIFEESKDDVKILMLNRLDELLRDEENQYKYEWNDDCSIVSVYYNTNYDQSLYNSQYISTVSMFCSTTIQAINENPDWHLTINYYDYNTKKILKTEIIR